MLGAILGGASLLGKLFGGGAKASAEGRRDDALIQNQLAAQNNRAMVDAAQFNLQAPSVLGNRMLGASGLMNFTPRGTSGGAAALASSLGRSVAPDGKGYAAGDPQNTALRQALMQMLGQSGRSIQNRDYQARPQQAQMPKAGLLEKIGGWAGMLGGLAGGANMLRGGGSPGTSTMGYGGY